MIRIWLLALTACVVDEPRRTTPPPAAAAPQGEATGGFEPTGGFESSKPPAPARPPAPTRAPEPEDAPAPRGEGRDEVTMLDVVGLPLDKAKAKLRAAGITGEIRIDGTGRRVCGSTPGAGRKTLGHLVVGLTMCGD